MDGTGTGTELLSPSDTSSLFGIDSENPDLMHVWELGNHQHKNRHCVQQQHRVLIVGCVGCYQVQHNRYNSKKLPVASELFATINLLPPSQPVVDALVISKGCSFLPVKEVICNQSVTEIDGGPGHARRTTGDGENDEPSEE